MFFGVIRKLGQFIRGLGEHWRSGPAFFLLCLFAFHAGCAHAQHWERLGPPGGMVTSMAAAADGTVYLGTPDGHIFASSDRGERWELRGRAGGRLDGVVQQIVPDAGNAKRLLAAIWFREAPGGGVFESADGARTWKTAGLEGEAVRTLEQAASDPNVWIAGTRRGVFRSSDDAQSWQRITSADDAELQNVDSLAVDPRDAQTIYVGTYHLPWKTTDGGKTWTSISTGMIDDSDVMSLRIDARDPQRIFSSACSGIYRSADGGSSWIKLQGIPYSSRRTQQIVQDPGDAQVWYAATTEGLWTTADYGETWKRITGRETDATAVVVLPGEKGKRVLGGMSAQGVLRSDDEGRSFAESNDGFFHRVIASVAADTSERRNLLVRADGYGTQLLQSQDGGKTWSTFEKPPPKPAERLFLSAAGWWSSETDGGLARFDARTRRWIPAVFRELSPPLKGRSSRAKPRTRSVKLHVRSLAQAGKLFVATDQGLWQFDEGRGEFRRASNAKNLPDSVSSLAATSSGGLLAIAGGEPWMQEAGGSWRQAAKPANVDGVLWIAEGGTAQKQILLGTERGVFTGGAAGDWRLISNGLPAIASITPAASGRRCLIAMSNGGFYESSDELKTWQRVDTNGETGRAGVVFATAEGFLVGTQQEGMLLWVIGKRNEH